MTIGNERGDRMELIEKQDIPLYVDIECTKCGRLVALSNAYQHKHQYLCPRCIEDIVTAINSLFKDQ